MDIDKRKTQGKDSLSACTERREHISRQKRKAMKEHSQTEEHQGRDLSGHGKKATKQGALTPWRPQREDLSGHRKNMTEQGALTSWKIQREGLVRTWKETNQARGTHILETAEGVTCQNTARTQLSKRYSLPGDGRGRDLSGHR